jgi:hypothetical protein
MMMEELEADERGDRYHEWLDEQPKCRTCGTLWREEGSIYDEENDEYFCDQTCVDKLEEARSERASEARFEKYWEGHGGVR